MKFNDNINFIKGKKSEESAILNSDDSIEYIPENYRLKVIGSPSSSLINSKNQINDSLKTLNELTYMYQRQHKSPQPRYNSRKSKQNPSLKLPKLEISNINV